MQRRFTTISLRNPALATLWLVAICVFGAVDFGPPIGSRFPEINLLGPKGAVVLLYDPAHAKLQLAELEQHRPAFQKLGLGLATMQNFAGHAARPGWIVLDPKGTVVAKYFEDDASQSYTSAALLLHRFGWTPPEAPREVEGKQLTATIGASNSKVAPGQRVALTVDIDLQPDMHVYAPGVEGYIPIDWKMENSDTALVHAPEYPRAEKLYLKAIDETVPAYRSHFRLIRDITIPPQDKLNSSLDAAGHFAVNSSLRYQACDARVCYIPQTLPLQWTFAVQAPDK
jgi:hypothetical protein